MKDTTLSPTRFVNIYEDKTGRFISDRDYPTYDEAYLDRDDLETYKETVQMLSSASPYRMFEAVSVEKEMPKDSGSLICLGANYLAVWQLHYDAVKKTFFDGDIDFKAEGSGVKFWLRPVLSTGKQESDNF